MPWAEDHIPKYRLHTRSGRAVVTIRGRDIYLGVHGTAESRAEYRRVLAEYLAAGCHDPRPPAGASLTWCELAARYLKFAEGYYRPPSHTPPTPAPPPSQSRAAPAGAADRARAGAPGVVSGGGASRAQRGGRARSCKASQSKTFLTIKGALPALLDLYGDTPVDAFGPLALKACRERIIASGKSRKTVNDYIGIFKRIVKWGVGEELVPARVLEGLRAVEGLKRGRSEARETAPVRPVPDEIVEATLPHCSPVLTAMIRVQRLTGMRPAEVCAMTAAQIDTSGRVWQYRPVHHKLSHLGPLHERVIPLGPKAQAVIEPFLRPGDVNRPLFSPAESEAWRREQHRAARSTKVSAAQDRRDARRRALSGNRLRPARDRFDTPSYGNAIENACRRAFPHPLLETVPRSKLTPAQQVEVEKWDREHRWCPNQLRHTAATEIRRAFGLDHAAAVLGHTELTTTQVYAERSRQTAEQVALALG